MAVASSSAKAPGDDIARSASDDEWCVLDETPLDVDAEGPTTEEPPQQQQQASREEQTTTAEVQQSPAPPEEPITAELDLCFVCDCTGSMGQYIRAAQQHIKAIVQRISKTEMAKVQFGLICYRDHPPQDLSYVTQTYEFTTDLNTMEGYVNTMSASGGGDGPEALTAGLHKALELPWRPNSTKVVVLIADAPPHGLELDGDGFPNGDPDGHDPLEIARAMAAHGIACYAVGCEPTLGRYRFARDFMCQVAEITGGQAVALDSASLLADVIVNGSAEEISLTKLQKDVEQEVQRVQEEATSRAEVVDREEISRRACQNLQSRGITSRQMVTDGGMRNMNAAIWNASPTSTLAEVKRDLGGGEPAPTLPGRNLIGMTEIQTEMVWGAPLASSRSAKGGGKGSKGMAFPEAVPRSRCAPAASYLFGSGGVPASAPAPSSAPSFAKPQQQQQQQSSTRNVLSGGLISQDQVSRLMQRSGWGA